MIVVVVVLPGNESCVWMGQRNEFHFQTSQPVIQCCLPEDKERIRELIELTMKQLSQQQWCGWSFECGKEGREWNGVSWNELKMQVQVLTYTFALNSPLLSCFSRLCVSVCVNDFKDDHYDWISDCNHVFVQGSLSLRRSGLSDTYISFVVVIQIE